MNKRKCQKGMTLIELIVAMAGCVLLIFVVSSLFSQAMIFFQSAHARFQMRDDARTSADMMTQFLQSGVAQSVSISRHNTASDPLYSMIAFNVSNGRGTNTGTPYKFFLDPNLQNQNFDLWMKVGTREPKKLAENVSDLKFFYPDSTNTTIIGIQMVFRKTVGKNVISLYRAINPVKLLPM